MKFAKILLTALAISTATITTMSANAGDYIEYQVRQDVNFDKNIEKAIVILAKKGYQVGEIDVDDRWGKPVLEIEAYKGYVNYDIVMSYPDLKIISERRDWDD